MKWKKQRTGQKQRRKGKELKMQQKIEEEKGGKKKIAQERFTVEKDVYGPNPYNC